MPRECQPRLPERASFPLPSRHLTTFALSSPAVRSPLTVLATGSKLAECFDEEGLWIADNSCSEPRRWGWSPTSISIIHSLLKLDTPWVKAVSPTANGLDCEAPSRHVVSSSRIRLRRSARRSTQQMGGCWFGGAAASLAPLPPRFWSGSILTMEWAG